MLSVSIRAALFVTSVFAPAALGSLDCKPLPGDPDWPSQKQWNALNETVSGRLAASVAVGAVCHPDKPVYDEAKCAVVGAQWVNSSFHSANPWSVDYNDITCIPDPSQPCSTDGYPEYVVKAECAKDVQAAVRFAKDTGVRLIVKGTGHDYLGRSVSPGALSIWTHLFQGVKVKKNDPRAKKYGGVGSVKVAAGMRFGEIYTAVDKDALTICGGSDPDVGVGGLLTNGGHSPISARYGFPADNVLEMEVVTADGELRVVNEDCEPDLFWALRGGGGSTFAIVLSYTLVGYPRISGTVYSLSINTTGASDTYYSMLTYFNTKVPLIYESGGMGYYFMFPNATLMFPAQPPEPGQQGQLLASLIFPELAPDDVDKSMKPLLEEIKSADWAEDPIYTFGTPSPFTSFMERWATTGGLPVGTTSRLGSWLLDKEALTGDFDNLKSHIQAVAEPVILGHIVAGPGVKDVKIPGGSNAILPAWRDAYTHIVLPRGWIANDAKSKTEVGRQLREQDMPTLKELAPDSGAYMNECDPTNPEWKHDYFGSNYPKLLEIKQKWDPEGVFWCRACVGNDEGWEVRDGPEDQDPVEWGIGQTGGRVCRTGKK